MLKLKRATLGIVATFINYYPFALKLALGTGPGLEDTTAGWLALGDYGKWLTCFDAKLWVP